ncbi:unnamed protein product, partial [Mycena citricolor]
DRPSIPGQGWVPVSRSGQRRAQTGTSTQHNIRAKNGALQDIVRLGALNMDFTDNEGIPCVTCQQGS